MSAAAVLFALMSTCAKALGHSMPSEEVAFFRAALTGLLVLPFALRLPSPLFGFRRRALFLRGLFGSTSLMLGFYAITQMPLGDAILLWQTSVFFVPIISVLFLGQPVKRRILAYSTLAFLGCALILKPEFTTFNIGGLAALGAGLGVALVSLTVKALHKTESSLTIIWCFGFYTSVLSIAFFGHLFRYPTLDELPLILGIGVFGTLGQLLFTESFRFASASVVQPYLFLQVVAAAALGWFFFGEVPDTASIIGAIIVIGCGIRIQSAAKNDALE